MIKSLVLGFSVCFHLGMFSLTSFQLFLFACISILEAKKSVAIFFFFKSLFLTKDPFPPNYLLIPKQDHIMIWLHTGISMCKKKNIFGWAAMYKECEKVKPTSCTGILTQGLCFYILTSAFCKTSLRKERSEVHSLPAIKLLSNATCRQETKRRAGKKKISSPTDTASRNQFTFVSCFKPLWEMCPLMVGPQKHPTARCSLQSLSSGILCYCDVRHNNLYFSFYLMSVQALHTWIHQTWEVATRSQLQTHTAHLQYKIMATMHVRFGGWGETHWGPQSKSCRSTGSPLMPDSSPAQHQQSWIG